MRRGDIVLVDFGKSRESFSFGKKRPALIVQSDKLNFAVKEGLYEYYLVVPLSTKQDILTEEFRILLPKREGLEQDSYAVCNSVCFLHKRYIEKKLASVNDAELKRVQETLKEVLELG